MPKQRQRYKVNGAPSPCAVTIAPNLAQYLYRERLKGKYKDETELVNAIIRRWAEAQDAVDWQSVLADLRTEAEANKDAGGDEIRGTGKKTKK